MSRFPFLLTFIGLLNLINFSQTSVDYENEFNHIEFIPNHSNEWVVKIDEGDDIADLVANELGLENKRKVIAFLLLLLLSICLKLGIFRFLIIIIYLLIHLYHTDQNVQQMILQIY